MDRDSWKARGNACVQAGVYPEAIEAYGHAVVSTGDDATAWNSAILCNRAFAWLQLGTTEALQQAVADCTSVLASDPRNVKALYRRALARSGLQQWQAAKSDLESIVALEPGNPQALVELDRVRVQIAAQTPSGLFNAEFQAKMLASIASGEALAPAVAPLPAPAALPLASAAPKCSRIDNAMASMLRECAVASPKSALANATATDAWRELQEAERTLSATKTSRKAASSRSCKSKKPPTPTPSAKTDILWQALLEDEARTRAVFKSKLSS
ncbi:hypothetical protein ACHHYP_14262 [Achlya hypogyna]|uniref:Uncharacterized protein n=1 Tax=Achlya hypogyna TaxID=1202772 RepID=A0A1V9YDG6_ACHHY|nr:hypothetical protein ACHHYP_14262 [Achlya hypogyna]